MDDSIRFLCPDCGKRWKAPPADARQEGRCSCGCRLLIPGDPVRPEPPPPVLARAIRPPRPRPPADRAPPDDDDHADDPPGITPADFALTAYLLLAVAGVIGVVSAVRAFGRADPETRAVVGAGAAALAAFVLLVTVVAANRRRGWWEAFEAVVSGAVKAVGWVAAGGLLVLALVAALVSFSPGCSGVFVGQAVPDV